MGKSKTESEKPKGARPVYNARAKQNPDNGFMVTIGAAWPFNEGVMEIYVSPSSQNVSEVPAAQSLMRHYEVL